MELDVTFDCDTVLGVVANIHEGVTVRVKIDKIDLVVLGEKIASWLREIDATYAAN